MLNDLRHGLRTLLRAKGWTAVVVLSLALGIGANTALFSAVNGLFLRKVPVRNPESLVRFGFVGQNDMATSSSDYGFSRSEIPKQNARKTFSYPMFQAFVAANQTLDDMLACAPYGRLNVVVDGKAEVAGGFLTTGNYYRMLGLTANPGRAIVPDDDKADAPPVAVISPKYWRSRFAGDPSVVGRVVQVNAVPVTIVGVISPELTDLQYAVREGPDIAMPLALESRLNTNGPAPGQPATRRIDQATYWWLQIVGRVKPGVTVDQVRANFETVFQNTARAGLESYLAGLSADARAISYNRNRTAIPQLRVQDGSRGIYDVGTNDTSSVTTLSVVVLVVLLIVCANVANLLLSRAATRQKELSVRLSLGATRGRLIRQLLTESLMLAVAGGALGILLGIWGKQLLPGAVGQPVPLDWRLLGFVLLVTCGTGVAFGIAPALRATSMNVSAALKETSRSVAGTRSILSRALLVGQVAASLVLLIAAGLFLRTLDNLRKTDVGFDTQNLVVFRLNPALNRYDDARMGAFFDEITERLRALPGVRGVAASNVPLLAGSVNNSTLFVAGRAYSPNPRENRDTINQLFVSPNFFETMGMPLKAGRGFTDRDDLSSPKVVVVNEAAVRQFFANQNPVGQHLGQTLETANDLEVVGVLRDAKYSSLREPPPPTLYLPQLQQRRHTFGGVFQVRTSGDAAAAVGAIREAVRHVDPNVPMTDVTTQVEQMEKRLTQERVFAQAYALFGLLAMLIAAIGLFGLMSYSVARRTNEIGIRMALGAESGDVLRLVMRESLVLVTVGIAIGIAVALAAGRFVESLLFGVAPADAATMTAATLVMIAVSALAGYLPARRASRVDPIVALHYE